MGTGYDSQAPENNRTMQKNVTMRFTIEFFKIEL